MNLMPNLLAFSDGRAVTPDNWPERRKEILDLLSREEYGQSPEAPDCVDYEITDINKKCCSGHAVLESGTVSFDTPGGRFSFPVRSFLPNDGKRHPLLVFISFSSEAYHHYYAPEEIVDRGFAVVTFYYQDVSSDDGDFNSGIAACYPRDEKTGWGKIGMWAFAASRVVDAFCRRPEVDSSVIGVCGHSRLGKTALWCGAQNERIRFILSNDSGCSGAAYERVKGAESETLAKIVERFPYWFCGNFRAYGKDPDSRPFDQHFLIAASAPRFVLVNSASRDLWADPYGEQRSVLGASSVWELLTGRGFIGPETPAKVGDRFLDGNLGYTLRDGIHFFGRADWNSWMDFIEKHR